MLDPADCGPVFLGLCQDTQGEAFDYPEVFFEPKLWLVPRPRPDVEQLVAAAELLRKADKPLIVAGGGVHYSLATAELATFAETHRVPVVETIAGRACLPHDHPSNAGPLGVIGSASANALAAEADVVLAVGTRLQDFTTGSWTVFGNPEVRLIALNAAGSMPPSTARSRWSATRRRASPSCRPGSPAGGRRRPGRRAPPRNTRLEPDGRSALRADQRPLPSYAQVVGAINRACDPTDLALTAAGGLPGELCKNWKAKSVGTFDCEFGFSCMGYESRAAGAPRWPSRSATSSCSRGDGSYLMMNSASTRRC